MSNKTGNRRSLRMVLAIVMALAFASASVYAIAAAAPKGTAKISKFAKKKKAVPFNHDKHIAAGYYKSCKKCHHTSEGAVKGADAKCTTCHTEPAKDDKTPGAKKAFHKSCKTCHKKLEKAGKPTGPTKCGECHSG